MREGVAEWVEVVSEQRCAWCGGVFAPRDEVRQCRECEHWFCSAACLDDWHGEDDWCVDDDGCVAVFSGVVL